MAGSHALEDPRPEADGGADRRFIPACCQLSCCSCGRAPASGCELNGRYTELPVLPLAVARLSDHQARRSVLTVLHGQHRQREPDSVRPAVRARRRRGSLRPGLFLPPPCRREARRRQPLPLPLRSTVPVHDGRGPRSGARLDRSCLVRRRTAQCHTSWAAHLQVVRRPVARALRWMTTNMVPCTTV